MAAVFGDHRRKNSPSRRSIAYLAVAIAVAENFVVAAERREPPALGYDLGPPSLSAQFASSSVTKCCPPGQLLSLRDGEPCVPGASPSASNFTGISVGLPRNLTTYESASSPAQIHQFFANGSLTAGYAHLAPSEYCIDAQQTDGRFVLVVGRAETYLRVDQPLGFMVVFWTSFLLGVATLIIHLALPELRRRVHDKCFVCYLAFLGCSAVILNSYYFIPRPEPYVGTIGLLLIYGFIYTTISSFFWLNVMCIHLWRTVTNMHPIPGRSFYVYALYASTVPLILIGIGKQFFGLKIIQNNFMYIIFEGHLNLDPTIQFNVKILAVLQIINLLAFVRVAYIIWYLKQSPESDTESQKRNAAQILKFSQLFRLSVIMGIYWINIFLMSYTEETIYIFSIIYKYFNLCPGYLIFIKFVLRSKQVMSALEKRYYYIIINK